MLLSELAQKELIEMENGVRIGFLSQSECLFDPTTGKINGFSMAQPLKNPFSKKQEQELFIPWEEIKLIGEDRILFQKMTNKHPHI